MDSRTEVSCSQPVRGNYGQVQLDRWDGGDSGGRTNSGSASDPSHRTAPPSPAPRAAYATFGCNLTDLSDAIRRNPKDADAYVTRAVCYMTFGPNDQKPPLKNMEAAVKDLEAALKLAPRNFFAHHNYAHAAYLLGYDDFAVYEFNKAIALNPNSGRSYMGRGFAYLEMCSFKSGRLRIFRKPSSSTHRCAVKWQPSSNSPTIVANAPPGPCRLRTSALFQGPIPTSITAPIIGASETGKNARTETAARIDVQVPAGKSCHLPGAARMFANNLFLWRFDRIASVWSSSRKLSPKPQFGKVGLGRTGDGGEGL